MSVDLQGDLQTVIQQKGTGVMPSEQILVDCYVSNYKHQPL